MQKIDILGWRFFLRFFDFFALFGVEKSGHIAVECCCQLIEVEDVVEVYLQLQPHLQLQVYKLQSHFNDSDT